MSVTLVKDTQHILPVDPKVRRRAALYYVETAPVSYLNGTDKAKQIVIEELERAGFEVEAHTDYYEMEAEKMSPVNAFRIMATPSVEEFKKKYDIVFVFVHMAGYAKENNVRLVWSAAHSSELPWYVHEVPTVGVSLNYTNHLYDLPMLKTFINAYAPTREYIRAAVEKITGKSEFKGKANELVWCGRWDTRR
jgi:beta-N-acetylhexosaminidase